MPQPLDTIRKMFSLTPEAESMLVEAMRERVFRRGEHIDGRGELRGYIYYIISGMARVYYLRNGRDHTTAFAMDNEFIPLSHMLVNSDEIVTRIEFLERTKVAYMPHRPRMKEISDTVEVTPFFLAGMYSHVRQLEERTVLLQTATARQRYRWMVDRYPRIVERANVTQIASFLGLTRETLYRIRSGKYQGN